MLKRARYAGLLSSNLIEGILLEMEKLRAVNIGGIMETDRDLEETRDHI
ncbi:MAG: hypothetical protein SVY15_09025 [Halobacteriota archaeon]|nr:hypothetical protein [Halobacteriota archaeon]